MKGDWEFKTIELLILVVACILVAILVVKVVGLGGSLSTYIVKPITDMFCKTVSVFC